VLDKHGNWYLLRILPYTTRGQVDGAVVTLIDITSLKQAESKLAELSEIVEHSDDAIFRQDVDGTIRTWNRGAERLFGLSATKVLGGHVEVLGLRCNDIDVEQMLKLVECGQSLEHVEARYPRKDGTVADVALSLSPIRDPQGNVIGASSIARDVTKHKQAEAKVREAVRRRDEFLAMLSHELRNPLAAVLNATNVLTEAENDRAVATEARDVIDHNVRHVARILDDLLDVSRITNDKINLHREVVDLSALLIDVVECVQHRIDAKNQELHYIPTNDPLFVEGDVGRLQQMQVNLLVNSSKYTSEGGKIEYRLEKDGDDAIITITDNGVGIEEGLMESIFEPFVQADQTIDRAQGGMGLGLTLVRKVAEAHKGSVSVDSEGVDQGSTFTVRLPTTRKRPQRKPELSLADDNDMRIMIVEDNEGVRKMLARTLELKGLTVHAVPSGRTALEQIRDFRPTVAIVDIGLPDVDGYEVARRVRQMPECKDLLLVAVTGYGRDRDRDTAIAAGFDIHLVKPLDPNELLRAIAEKYGRVGPPRPKFLNGAKEQKKSGGKSEPLPPPVN
ncbi:MAG: PAS domain S-box protein, partial [Planctomycetota bacterium]